MNGRRGQPLHALLKHKPANLIRIVFGPDDEDVGDGTVGDPGLGAGDLKAAVHLLRPRDHASGVGAVPGFGQAKTADPFAGRELRQELLLLGFGAEFIDGHHDERPLDAHHRAEARIDAFHFPRHQTVRHVTEPRAAVLLGDDDAEHVERAKLPENRRVHTFVAEHVEHTRRQLVGTVLTRRLADHPLVVGQLLVEKEGVSPVETGF